MHIDHITIRTSELEKTKDFLTRIFDLTEGLRPQVIAAAIRGHWLYWKYAPIVHLIESSSYYKNGISNSTEGYDHIGFYMHDYTKFKQKLIQLNISFSLMDLPEIGERRIFLNTPTGILIETIFREKI